MSENGDNKEDIRDILRKAMVSKNDPKLKNKLSLITPEDEVFESAQRSVRKRQCANCTCSLSKKPSEKPKSSCGNCSRGDAFRCASCPYMGMPAFEEGKEFKFGDDLNDL
ncbi:hypothetical protein PAEPH01_0297 [Pancytospora epiphaga]|nr:hypothetical protein PAEPH01_0297 [Pancytospora epiphaga]